MTKKVHRLCNLEHDIIRKKFTKLNAISKVFSKNQAKFKDNTNPSLADFLSRLAFTMTVSSPLFCPQKFSLQIRQLAIFCRHDRWEYRNFCVRQSEGCRQRSASGERGNGAKCLDGLSEIA
jgi:hypothetical protein